MVDLKIDSININKETQIVDKFISEILPKKSPPSVEIVPPKQVFEPKPIDQTASLQREIDSILKQRDRDFAKLRKMATMVDKNYNSIQTSANRMVTGVNEVLKQSDAATERAQKIYLNEGSLQAVDFLTSIVSKLRSQLDNTKSMAESVTSLVQTGQVMIDDIKETSE